MNASKILKLIPILLILTPLSLGATIKPANVTEEELKKIIESDPADEIKISFWELPLWIKVYEIVAIILGTLGILKLLPLAITKIKSALENVKRQKILKIIMKNPGISLKELEDYTKMNRSTLRFHLNFLESEGWIYSIKIGKHRSFFLNDSSNVNHSAFIKSEKKRQILELLNQNEKLTIKEIADKLGISYKTAHRHISQLRNMGIIAVDDGTVKLKINLDRTNQS